MIFQSVWVSIKEQNFDVDFSFLLSVSTFCHMLSFRVNSSQHMKVNWYSKMGEDLLESITLCYDAQVVGLCLGSSPVRLTVLAANSEDCATDPKNIKCMK